jgi:ubiquinone/menaquinone biosynthesis C-methylase UbiE
MHSAATDPNGDPIRDLYTTDRYIAQNPTLHGEDTAWKLGLVLPLVDAFAKRVGKRTVTVLDVGGGAGLLLKAIAGHLARRHGLKCRQLALDLSPGMLDLQARNNPDLERTILGDATQIPLADGEVDLVLMLDVIEHVPEPAKSHAELRRVAGHVLYKIPLEDNVLVAVLDRIRGGSIRAELVRTLGHVNSYTIRRFTAEVARHVGKVVKREVGDVFSYYLSSPDYRPTLSRRQLLVNRVGAVLYRVAPSAAARLLGGSAAFLVACRRDL